MMAAYEMASEATSRGLASSFQIDPVQATVWLKTWSKDSDAEQRINDLCDKFGPTLAWGSSKPENMDACLPIRKQLERYISVRHQRRHALKMAAVT